jgi:DNA-directed RNA polymerase subunit M/transcription elongation factor TFIIS
MPLFCNQCRNLLVIVSTHDTLMYKCNKCEILEEPSINDYKVYESVSGVNLGTYRSLLAHASQDPVNPKVMKKCKCGYNMSKQVRLGDEMKLVNTCIKCNNQWLDGSLSTDIGDFSESNEKAEKTEKSKKSTK